MKAKDIIVGIVFIFLLGSLFHFTYELSSNNSLVAIFSSVNESTFEHTKILIYPTIIWYLIFYFKNIKEVDKNKLFSSLVVNLLTEIIILPVIYYTFIGIFGINNTLVNLLIFILSSIIGFYASYIFYKKEVLLPYKIILPIIIILFTYFTFYPLNIPYFMV